ncbi:MAG: cupin domain-containing protein [Phycisphaerales bacterium]|jgi:quercetin dioxygenase-like cupin family protein
MTDDADKVNVLADCLGKAKDLSGLVDYVRHSIVSKTIVDKPTGTITLFAFDAGQGLSEHTTPYNATVLVLDGSAKLTIGGDEEIVASGQIIIMPPDVPHSVTAEERFKMLLVMIRS